MICGRKIRIETMYNGIGLQTARGSGTNGHVQRNLSFVRQGKKDNVKYKTEADLSKAEAINNRQPNEEILEHERKRKIEVKILEFEDILEEQDYTPEEIAAKVQAFREKLLNETAQKDELPKDEFGRYAVRETHQLAAAKHEKNAMLRSAFGISEYFVEGSSFDSDRKAKEELAKSAALQKELDAQKDDDGEKNKRYRLVRTPSIEKEVISEPLTIDGTKKKSTKSSEDKLKKKKHDKSKDRRNKKKKKKVESSESNSSSDDDGARKKSRRKRKISNSSDDSSESSSNSEPIEKRKKRHHGKDKKKHSTDTKKSSTKKHRHRSTSSSSSDSSDSSRSSSSSSSSSSASNSPHKDKRRRV